jgi:hypothetical protein
MSHVMMPESGKTTSWRAAELGSSARYKPTDAKLATTRRT